MPNDGRLLACDISDDYTRVGRPCWRQAGVAHKVVLRLAPALETLDAQLAAGAAGHCDFAFIDADETGYDACYERCLQLLRARTAGSEGDKELERRDAAQQRTDHRWVRPSGATPTHEKQDLGGTRTPSPQPLYLSSSVFW